MQTNIIVNLKLNMPKKYIKKKKKISPFSQFHFSHEEAK